jgi:hypothetical protein
MSQLQRVEKIAVATPSTNTSTPLLKSPILSSGTIWFLIIPLKGFHALLSKAMQIPNVSSINQAELQGQTVLRTCNAMILTKTPLELPFREAIIYHQDANG